MRLGARMFKTGLAVAIALYAAALIGFPSTVFAGFAAVFAIQPSIYQSYITTLKQLQANFIGVTISITFAYLLGNNPIIVGLSVMFVISLCRFLKIEKSAVSIALIAVISVMETTTMPIYLFGLMRFSSLMLGIFSAFLVNLLFIPPRYETTLFQQINQITTEILKWLRITTRHLSDDPSLKKEMSRIEKELRRMDELYALFSEERVYRKKKHPVRARKLVVFRQLIKTTHRSFRVLRSIQKVDNRAKLMPEDLQRRLIHEIDIVIHAHERIMLGFMRKIKRGKDKEYQHLNESNIPDVVDQLLELYQKNEVDYLIFLPLASMLMNYHQDLSHLQKLLNSYDQFHGNEKLDIIPKYRDLEDKHSS
ncbi:MAG: FUSC family protein [Bacillota bacterium]